MTGGGFPVAAQWALHGKVPDAEGYKVVACSTGELDRVNFADAIGRFSLGALDRLPQVSVSYLQPATRPGGSYLALAVHWFAVPGQRHADGVLPLDDFGRQTAFTSYFCAPYQQLAAEGVSYLDLYRAFDAVTLPPSDGPPEPVTITPAAPALPAIGELELRAAALLLTGTPVCVLGAEQTDLGERLAFIDTVMALLPYGFRARMAAATWTKATNRDHKFRLFFSSAPRSARPPDHVLTWNQPDQAPSPAGHAQDYVETLADKLSPVARLRELTTEIGFGAKAATQALELLDGTRHRTPRRAAAHARGGAAADADGRGAGHSRDRAAADGRGAGQPVVPDPGQSGPGLAGRALVGRALVGPAPVGLARADRARRAAGRGESGLRDAADTAEADPRESALTDCADAVRSGNVTGLRSAIRWLENQAKTSEPGAADRAAYRTLIARHGLLAPHPELKKQEGELYAALLSLAFPRPLTYQGYCRAEKCLGVEPGTALHPGLLAAMERGGLADPVVTALVLDQLDTGRLHKWLRSRQVDAAGLIDILADTWPYAVHGQLFCDVVLVYLRTCQDRYDPVELRASLGGHGFLARALFLRHPDNEQYQFYALDRLLRAAYPGGLDRAAILEVLTGAGSPPPTPALFAAVLKLLDSPADWELAARAYSHGSATLIAVDRVSAGRLRERVPDIRPAVTLSQ